jgi:hypothetical protein
LPADVIALHPGVPVLKKPLHPESILDSLVKEIHRLRALEGSEDRFQIRAIT